MPELPEVEVVCQGLAPHVTGKTVTDISFSNKKLRKPVPRAQLNSLVRGVRIASVTRRAKFILLTMENSALLVFHLGMTGKLGLFAKGAPRRKHDHLRFDIEGGKEVRFNDIRRFGFVEVFSAEDLKIIDPFAKLGPEPFAKTFSAAYLLERATKKRQAVKNFLMDNRVVVGIGNIYANETLFSVGLHPETPVNIITQKTWQQIVTASRKVLKKAIKSGGTTISDYENASGESGYFQLELAVYGREGQPCHTCKTSIERLVIGGRASFFCPTCQI